MNDYQLAENAHTRGLVRTLAWALVGVVASISTCCIFFPWEPTASQRCVEMCRPKSVQRFIAPGSAFDNKQREWVKVQATCECAP